MRISIACDRRVVYPIPRNEIARIVRETLAAEGLRRSDPWEVSLRFVSAEQIREMNRSWRSIDRATDVISFPAQEGAGGKYAGFLLGDIVIAPAVVAAHAHRYRTGLARETTLVIVHGLLHLLGYDHDIASRRTRMRQREKEIHALLKP